MNQELIFEIILKVLATSGAAAWVSSFLTNKRGGNKILDLILDVIELVAGNVNRSSNDKRK